MDCVCKNKQSGQIRRVMLMHDKAACIGQVVARGEWHAAGTSRWGKELMHDETLQKYASNTAVSVCESVVVDGRPMKELSSMADPAHFVLTAHAAFGLQSSRTGGARCGYVGRPGNQRVERGGNTADEKKSEDMPFMLRQDRRPAVMTGQLDARAD